MGLDVVARPILLPVPSFKRASKTSLKIKDQEVLVLQNFSTYPSIHDVYVCKHGKKLVATIYSFKLFSIILLTYEAHQQNKIRRHELTSRTIHNPKLSTIFFPLLSNMVIHTNRNNVLKSKQP